MNSDYTLSSLLSLPCTFSGSVIVAWIWEIKFRKFCLASEKQTEQKVDKSFRKIKLENVNMTKVKLFPWPFHNSHFSITFLICLILFVGRYPPRHSVTWEF